MPGGVSSPVRAYAPYPRYIRRGRGSRIWDVDGRSYVDYCLGFGPLIHGHAHPYVVERVRQAVEDGVLFGAPTEGEVRLARKVRTLFPSIEAMRFVNSGTEATMHAVRLARGFTGRPDIVKVEGGFHGAHDAMLVKAGSGATTFSAPDSLGVPRDVAKHTLLVPFNDLDAMGRVVKRRRKTLAAVLLEPMLGNVGPIPPRPGYVEGVREITEEHDVLLILDEVITGFRLALGGAQERFRVAADLTALGKVLGGGLPVGLFGGRRDIMDLVSPLGKVYQAGTFSGNPVTMAAGLATVEWLERVGLAATDALAARLRDGLQDVLARRGLPARVQGMASMYQLFFSRRPVTDYAAAKGCDAPRFLRLFRALLRRGVYVPPSQYETCFLSTAHTVEDVEATLEAYEACLKGAT
jgi:glutamate-1-semialdehyde 2,1-aminomutase